MPPELALRTARKCSSRSSLCFQPNSVTAITPTYFPEFLYRLWECKQMVVELPARAYNKQAPQLMKKAISGTLFNNLWQQNLETLMPQRSKRASSNSTPALLLTWHLFIKQSPWWCLVCTMAAIKPWNQCKMETPGNLQVVLRQGRINLILLPPSHFFNPHIGIAMAAPICKQSGSIVETAPWQGWRHNVWRRASPQKTRIRRTTSRQVRRSARSTSSRYSLDAPEKAWNADFNSRLPQLHHTVLLRSTSTKLLVNNLAHCICKVECSRNPKLSKVDRSGTRRSRAKERFLGQLASFFFSMFSWHEIFEVNWRSIHRWLSSFFLDGRSTRSRLYPKKLVPKFSQLRASSDVWPYLENQHNFIVYRFLITGYSGELSSHQRLRSCQQNCRSSFQRVVIFPDSWPADLALKWRRVPQHQSFGCLTEVQVVVNNSFDGTIWRPVSCFISS